MSEPCVIELQCFFLDIDNVKDLYSKKNTILLEEFNIDVKFSKSNFLSIFLYFFIHDLYQSEVS